MADADFSDEVPQSLGCKYDRVAIDLFLEIFAGHLFKRLAAGRILLHAMIRPPQIGRNEAAAMSRDNFYSGVTIQRSIEDQVGERDGGLQRIADYVSQIAIAS